MKRVLKTHKMKIKRRTLVKIWGMTEVIQLDSKNLRPSGLARPRRAMGRP